MNTRIGVSLISLLLISTFPAARADTIYVAQDMSSRTIATASTSGGTATTLINLATNADPHQIVIGGSFLFVADDSNLGLVSEYTLNGTFVTNISTEQIVGGNTVNTAPVGLAFSGSDLYVAMYDTGDISKYTINPDGTVASSSVDLFTVGTGAFSLASSGSNIYIANQANGKVSEYNTITQNLTTLISSGLSAPSGLAVSGNALYVANSTGNTIGEYNATTGAAVNASLIKNSNPGTSLRNYLNCSDLADIRG